jgi:serine/threonine protein kinase
LETKAHTELELGFPNVVGIMSTNQQVSRQTFLAKVRESGLLSETQLAQAEAKLPDSTRGRVVARALVELGLLTKFQAERILIGRTSGFTMGQYRILDQLGRGGMGRVFKARHRTMDRVVALKVLAPEAMKTERAQELFMREVRAAATLTHPNIVTAFDANEADGRYFLVLEFVDGPNLEQLVRDRGPLPVSQACDFIRQTALGLQCADQRGMLHRDIKPGNLLVQHGGADGHSPDLIKISDFGLARLQAPNTPVEGDPAVAGTILTRENTVMGTPDYLSPEQARNLHRTDIRSDLYSLGCTFFYLLTGQVPFPGGKTMDKLIRHSAERPQAVAELRPAVPEPVAAIVHRLMAKHPDDRFQTPAELIEALTPFAVAGSTSKAPELPETGAAALEGTDESKSYSSDPEVAAASASDELSALVNTASNEFSPTPAEFAPIITPRRRSTTQIPALMDKRNMWPTIFIAGGIAGGLFLLGGLLVLLAYLHS